MPEGTGKLRTIYIHLLYWSTVSVSGGGLLGQTGRCDLRLRFSDGAADILHGLWPIVCGYCIA